MSKTSTYQDLLRYAYNETTMMDADRIQRCIDGDTIIKDDFNEIVSVMDLLDGAKLQPSDKSINKIMDFARKA